MISITINSLPSKSSPFVILTGQRDTSIVSIFVDGSSYGTRFPTNTTWERDVEIRPGNTSISVYATDSIGNTTDTVQIPIPAEVPKSFVSSVFNSLDEKGLILNIPRLKGEKNLNYRNRLQHAETELGGTNYRFLLQALRRDLSLAITEDSLEVIVKETNGRPVATNVFLTIESTRLTVEADQLRKDNETVLLDPGNKEFTLTKELRSSLDLFLTTRGGVRISPTDIEVLDDNQTIRVYKSPGQLLATYKYIESLSWSTHSTITAIRNQLNTMVTDSGITFMTATMKASASSLLSKNLVRQGRVKIDQEETTKFDVMDFRIVEAWDKRFQDSLLDEYGLYFGTKLEWIANSISGKSNTFFRDTTLDRDRVINRDIPRSFSVLPTLTDSRIGYYKCLKSSDTKRYTTWDFKAYNGYCPNHSTHTLTLEGHTGFEMRGGVGSQLKAFDVKEV